MTGSPAQLGQNAARVRASKRRQRLVRSLAIVVGAVVVVVAGWRIGHSRASLPPNLITGKAERMDLTQTVSATGSVTAQTGAMVRIGSQITGRIKRLFADVGSQMQAGEVIAELDLPDLEAQVRQAEATLAVSRRRLAEQLAGVSLQATQTATDIEKARSALAVARANQAQVERSADLQRATAEAGVRQAQANAANASANLKRMEQLFAKGYVAASDVDAARTQDEVSSAQLSSAQENRRLVDTKLEADLESARQQVAQAEANLKAARAATAQNAIKEEQIAEARAAVEQAEASLAYARAQREKGFIRTPISGTVLQLTQQQGETIAAGLSAPTVIIVADLSRLQVDAFVDETDIGRVRLGQPAEITLDAYPDQRFFGRVAKIASGATLQQNVVTYDVTIALEKASPMPMRSRPGEGSAAGLQGGPSRGGRGEPRGAGAGPRSGGGKPEGRRGGGPQPQLKPDMTATVNITVMTRKKVLAVPIDAVQQGRRGPSVTVMRIGPEGKPSFEPVNVRTGINDGEHMEILEGLKEGDVVVVSGQVSERGGQEGGGPPRWTPFGFGGGRGGGRGGR